MLHLGADGLRALAWLGENFPDSARVGWSYLLAGIVLISATFLPRRSGGDDSLVYALQSLLIIAGIVCALLGAFVFFRKVFGNCRNAEIDSRCPIGEHYRRR